MHLNQETNKESLNLCSTNLNNITGWNLVEKIFLVPYILKIYENIFK